jgi:hypothetical protein
MFVSMTSVQSFAAEPSRATNGIKMGLARLHPSFEFSTRYDSYAVQLTETGKAGDLILRFRPGLALELPSAHYELRLRGAVDYAHYLGVESDKSKDASYVGARASIDLQVKPSDTFIIELSDGLRRSDETSAPTLQVGVLSLYNDTSLKLRWRPWRGTLAIEPSYLLTTEVFSSRNDYDNLGCSNGFGCMGWEVNESSYLNHAFGLATRWNFLPKSTFLFDLRLRMRRYLGDNGVDSDSVVASVGASSILLPRLTIGAAFGWAQEFDGIYSNPIARLTLTYALTAQSKLSLGYERAFQPTPSTKWVAYSTDRVYLDVGFLFAGRFALDASLQGTFTGYRADGNEVLDTQQFDAKLKGAWEIFSWLRTGLSYRFTYSDQLAGITDFTRHDATFFLELSY